MPTHRLPLTGALALALVLVASSAQAKLTTDACLAKKRQAHGKFEQCRATVAAKGLEGKPADIGKCSTKLGEQIAKLSEKATDAGIDCRYRDNGDGTVTDFDTGLQWERKNGVGGGENEDNPHDADNLYTWSVSGSTVATGRAFTEFLGRLNTCSFAPGFISTFGFAFQCDWRLPTRSELLGIVASCTGGFCIDPVFGPTGQIAGSSPYWTATTSSAAASQAWRVSFIDGSSETQPKVNAAFVRAVRNAF